MNFILFVVFISLLHVPIHAAKAYLVPAKIQTQTGASYVLMIKHETAVPIECYAQNGTQKYSIDLFHSGLTALPLPNENYTIQPKAGELDVITSLGNGVCGLKVDSVSPFMLQYNWNLSFVDQLRNSYSAVAVVTIRRVSPRQVVKFEKIGNSLLIDCPSDEYDIDCVGDMINCQLFDPQNQLVKSRAKKCGHSVAVSKVSDFGVWKCLLTYENYMFPTEVTFEFIPKETDVVQTWTNSTDNHVNVGCSVTNATSIPGFCVMVRPDGKRIALMPGLATKRYMALDTNLTASVCALQIIKPLEDAEKGLWKCEQHSMSAIGGFVNVSAENSQFKTEPILPTGLFAHINTTLEIKCQVQFSSPYCYMRGPDGFMYPLNDYKNTSLGICYFVKEKTQITDNGTWMCGFGMQTGEPDAVYTFQVLVPQPEPIQAEVQDIESRTAGVARLVCTTRGLGDYPLKYCRFLSPDGNMYHIKNHQTSDRISYEGRGLEYGDCGINLQDVGESDQGTWSCITRLDRTEEVYTNIHLTINDSLSVASTLGISFGMAAIVIIGTVFFLHRYHKRRNYQTTFGNSDIAPRVSQDSSESQNQDIVFNVLQDNVGTRNYNSTDVEMRTGSENISNPFGSESESDQNSVFDVIDDTVQHRR